MTRAAVVPAVDVSGEPVRRRRTVPAIRRLPAVGPIPLGEDSTLADGPGIVPPEFVGIAETRRRAR